MFQNKTNRPTSEHNSPSPPPLSCLFALKKKTSNRKKFVTEFLKNFFSLIPKGETGLTFVDLFFFLLSSRVPAQIHNQQAKNPPKRQRLVLSPIPPPGPQNVVRTVQHQQKFSSSKRK